MLKKVVSFQLSCQTLTDITVVDGVPLDFDSLQKLKIDLQNAVKNKNKELLKAVVETCKKLEFDNDRKQAITRNLQDIDLGDFVTDQLEAFKPVTSEAFETTSKEFYDLYDYLLLLEEPGRTMKGYFSELFKLKNLEGSLKRDPIFDSIEKKDFFDVVFKLFSNKDDQTELGRILAMLLIKRRGSLVQGYMDNYKKTAEDVVKILHPDELPEIFDEFYKHGFNFDIVIQLIKEMPERFNPNLFCFPMKFTVKQLTDFQLALDKHTFTSEHRQVIIGQGQYSLRYYHYDDEITSSLLRFGVVPEQKLKEELIVRISHNTIAKIKKSKGLKKHFQEFLVQLPSYLWPDVKVIEIPDGKKLKQRLGLEIQGEIATLSGDKYSYKLSIYLSEGGHFRVINSGAEIDFSLEHTCFNFNGHKMQDDGNLAINFTVVAQASAKEPHHEQLFDCLTNGVKIGLNQLSEILLGRNREASGGGGEAAK